MASNNLFYKGIPEIFKTTTELLKSDPVCEEYNIKENIT